MKTEAEIQDWKSLKDFQSYSQAFSNLFGTYTKSINKAYHRSGSLFEKNFNRIPIDSDRYFIHLISYIHRNPQKHSFTDNFRTSPYSSYQTIQQQKQSRIEYAQALQWFGNLQTFENYHQSFDDSHIRHLIENDG